MKLSFSPLRRLRWPVAGILATAVTLALVGRFHHPYYGFTKLLQVDQSAAAVAVHELREQPVFVSPDPGGYDGQFYAQLAYHPLLGSPELTRALDNLPYRARRILGSAIAFGLAAGRDRWIAEAYALVNVFAWLALAPLLWRALGVANVRGFVAWGGLMFSAGVLGSVRYALTDLLALLGVVAALVLLEAGRRRFAVIALAAAGLARETSLLAAAGLVPAPGRPVARWLRQAAGVSLAALPLGLWIASIQWHNASGDQGLGNLDWPFVGLAHKLASIGQGLASGQLLTLWTTTALATLALLAQATFLLTRRLPDDPWWRAGVASLVLLPFLGPAVFDGHPGAAGRTLLPMSAAFAVLAVRRKASLAWLLAGGLGVFAGIEPWIVVPHDRYELAAGRTATHAFVVRTHKGFYPIEGTGEQPFAWSSGRGVLELRAEPRANGPWRMRLAVRAPNDRSLELSDGVGVRWSGPMGTDWKEIECEVSPEADGRVRLRVTSPEPPAPEGDGPEARRLAFAVRDPRLLP